MSARIKVTLQSNGGFGWKCSQERHPESDWGSVTVGRAASIWSIADAVNDGMKHLAEYHAPTVGTYCRAHGCQRFECGCWITTPVQPANGAGAPGNRNALKVAPRGHTERSTGSSDDFPCCADLTPDILRAHTTSREDA